jgi:hypothetical protein
VIYVDKYGLVIPPNVVRFGPKVKPLVTVAPSWDHLGGRGNCTVRKSQPGLQGIALQAYARTLDPFVVVAFYVVAGAVCGASQPGR